MNEVEEVRFWLDVIEGMRNSCHDYTEAVYKLERVKLKDMANVDDDDILMLCKEYPR